MLCVIWTPERSYENQPHILIIRFSDTFLKFLQQRERFPWESSRRCRDEQLNVHNFIAELKSHRYSYENVFVFVVIDTFSDLLLYGFIKRIKCS